MATLVVRVVGVTLGLMALGVCCGAILGAIASFVESYGLTRWHPLMLREAAGVLFFGAYFGAHVGAVLAPLLAWVFLRRAPLGRAIAQTSLGTLAGVLAGAVFAPGWVVPVAIAGFVTATARLYVVTRGGSRELSLPRHR